MKYAVKIEVSLKPGHSNPEAETTAHLLKELGYQVESVGVDKIYTVLLNVDSLADAKSKAEEMGKRLLANPTKDNYNITIVAQQ